MSAAQVALSARGAAYGAQTALVSSRDKTHKPEQPNNQKPEQPNNQLQRQPNKQRIPAGRHRQDYYNQNTQLPPQNHKQMPPHPKQQRNRLPSCHSALSSCHSKLMNCSGEWIANGGGQEVGSMCTVIHKLQSPPPSHRQPAARRSDPARAHRNPHQSQNLTPAAPSTAAPPILLPSRARRARAPEPSPPHRRSKCRTPLRQHVPVIEHCHITRK